MKYTKEFEKWNKVKREVEKNPRVFCHEKEIWWCNLGVNIGSEQDGKGESSLRPVYVFKVINPKVFIGIPLTRVWKKDKSNVFFYFNYDIEIALISQVRALDSKRLFELMGTTSDYVYALIKKALVDLISD